MFSNCTRFQLEAGNRWVEIEKLPDVVYRVVYTPKFPYRGYQMLDTKNQLYWIVEAKLDYNNPYITLVGWTKKDRNPFDLAGD